ncbi:MAG: Gfo/Idh/MocA family oxidoreductase [Phycisphaeraceae bacterium]
MLVERPLRVGVIGCGNISGAYLRHARTFSSMEIVACADMNESLAQAKATEFSLEARGVDDLLASEDVDIVLNITPPQAHASVNLQILEAGKHAYCEKPFALDRESAEQVLSLAKSKGLRVGCAPDTFLGGGHQTCRHLVDQGAIGTPVHGTAMMLTAGPESWHPNPDFYFLRGGGPLMDMGPYYITALVNMLGPVAEVQSMSHRSGERTCTSEKNMGRKLRVDVDTHLSANLRFEQGAIITMLMSFDTAGTKHRPIELHGTEGSLLVPDPNMFEGPVSLVKWGDREFEEVELTHGYTDNYRSIGLADMAEGVLRDRPHRVSGALAHHVLDVMLTVQEAAGKGISVSVNSTVERPEAMSVGLPVGELELV